MVDLPGLPGGAPGAPAPGGAPAIGGAPGGPPPKLPGNPLGGPPGPGATPAMAPGGGKGNEAAADSMISAILPAMHKALSAYAVGSKKYAAVLNALRALTANFGKEQQQTLVPSAVTNMAMAAKGGQPLEPAPPPGVAPPPAAAA